MSPQARGTVPEKQAQRLVAAGKARAEATVELEDAIVDALRAGGSYAEVAVLVGMTKAGVYAIGKRHGWPTAAEVARRERMNTDEHRFDHMWPERWAVAEEERKRIAKEHEREHRRRD